MDSCILCKRKSAANCVRRFCPLAGKQHSLFAKAQQFSKTAFSAGAPAPFVGRFGYPCVNVGVLAPPEVKEDAWTYDAPLFWSSQEYQVRDIALLRSGLVNSRFKARVCDVRDSSSRMLDIAREVGMASRPVEVEVGLGKKPALGLRTDALLKPMGPQAQMRSIDITSNPKVHTKVDKVFSDTDRKSTDALSYLFKSGFDENFLSKVLSVGALGVRGQRKLVPTRWAITATDDTLSKQLVLQVKDCSFLDHCAFFGSYLGNYYLFLCFPDVWSYELFEMSVDGKGPLEYSTDHEFFDGRKEYARNCVGGYYSVRLSLAEKLAALKRQASVIALRFITDEYTLPLGVWVTRQASRRALEQRPLRFSDSSLLLKYARALAKRKFGVDIAPLIKESRVLKMVRSQSKLTSFFQNNKE